VRWEERHRFLVDATGTGFLLLFMVATSSHITGSASESGRTVATAVFAFAVVVPLAWRRVRPAASAAAVYTVALVQVAFWSPLVVPADVAVLIALYSVTVHGPRWAHRVAIVGALVGSVLLGAAVNGSYLSGAVATAVFTAALALTVWAFGLVRRSRRETISALMDRAHQLEVERDQQSQIATAADTPPTPTPPPRPARWARSGRPAGPRSPTCDDCWGCCGAAASGNRTTGRTCPGPGGWAPRPRRRSRRSPPSRTSAPWSSRCARAGCGRRWSGWARRATCRQAPG
jgi:hypothetical protein